MNVVDSSAWLSYFAVESLDILLVPSITVTEVFKHVLLIKGEELALEVIAQITSS